MNENRGWHIEFDKRITISDLVILIGLLTTMAAGWYGFDARITADTRAVLDQQRINTQILESLQRMSDEQQQQNEYLGKLQTRIEDYPLHRHIGSSIVTDEGRLQSPKR